MAFKKFRWTARYAFIDRLKYWQFVLLFSIAYSLLCPALFLLALYMLGLDSSLELKFVIIAMMVIYSFVWSHAMWETKRNKRS